MAELVYSDAVQTGWAKDVEKLFEKDYEVECYENEDAEKGNYEIIAEGPNGEKFNLFYDIDKKEYETKFYGDSEVFEKFGIVAMRIIPIIGANEDACGRG